MSRNDARPTIHSLTRSLRRSLGTWLLLALAVGGWTSQLAGQNAPPTYQSPNVVTDSAGANRTTPAVKKFTSPNLDRWRVPRPGQAAAPQVSSIRASKPATPATNPFKRDNAVVPASHEEHSGAAPGNLGISPQVTSEDFVPGPLPAMMPSLRPAAPGPSFLFPSERTVPPQITGSHLGLQPGETATERSLRLMTVIAELEQQNAELAEQNAKLNAELKAKEAKLQSSTSQITGARKELTLTQEELQRLRKEIANLREKFRSAEQENASLMRSLSPLLKQMLESDDDPPTKD